MIAVSLPGRGAIHWASEPSGISSATGLTTINLVPLLRAEQIYRGMW